jgi:hypothetical protein
MLHYIVQLTMMCVSPNLSPHEQKLMLDFLVDPHSATDQFHLEGKSVIYAVYPNPKCHCTYKPTFEGNPLVAKYPRFSSHKGFSKGWRCKELLTKPQVILGLEAQVPIKFFIYFDFKDWAAGLTS